MRLPKPSDDDFRQACANECLGVWDKIKARAREAQLRRLLDENQKLQQQLCVEGERLTATPGPDARVEWLKNSAAITKAFAEHDSLIRLAYPETFSAEGGL